MPPLPVKLSYLRIAFITIFQEHIIISKQGGQTEKCRNTSYLKTGSAASIHKNSAHQQTQCCAHLAAGCEQPSP